MRLGCHLAEVQVSLRQLRVSLRRASADWLLGCLRGDELFN